MYTIYQLFLTLLFFSALPFMLVYVLLTGKHREGLSQRMGLYKRLKRKSPGFRIWLHAASVGEVQAADVLIAELRQQLPDAEYVVTTMTIHGRKIAQSQLGDDITCLLAPLDVPGFVDLAIYNIFPDIYICLETELWPTLLRRLNSRSTPVVLANGRMSERSAKRYLKHRWLFKKVVDNFDALCMISEIDKERYLAIGVPADQIEVTGNLKYDRQSPSDVEMIRRRYREIIQINEDTEVFITGSTHTGEEEILIPVYQALSKDCDMVWIVAPRHLTRLGQIEELLRQNSIEFELFSNLTSGQQRKNAVILVDSFGELSELYSIGTYIFCGGSLVERNGHNILEPAIWDKVVMYGPSMGDFQDAIELLEMADSGVQVDSGKDLFEKISNFRENFAEYSQACERAGIVARAQQGAARRQARMIVSRLLDQGDQG